MSWGAKNKNSDSTRHRPRPDTKPSVQYVPEPVKIDVSSIIVPEGHREVDEGAIDGIADSIQAIGLQHPISVTRGPDGEIVLTAGRHRLEAYKRLGITRIPARIMEERWARLWSISENLHRVDQSQLDRADAIADYAKERGLLEGGPRAHPGGKQPNDKGNSRIARALRMNRKQVREARKHADICEEAKKALRLNGLDNSIKALKSVASCEGSESQIARARTLIEERRRSGNKKPRPKNTRAARDASFDGLGTNALLLRDLKLSWERLPFRKRFDKAPLKVRRRFIDEVLLLST